MRRYVPSQSVCWSCHGGVSRACCFQKVQPFHTHLQSPNTRQSDLKCYQLSPFLQSARLVSSWPCSLHVTHAVILRRRNHDISNDARPKVNKHQSESSTQTLTRLHFTLARASHPHARSTKHPNLKSNPSLYITPKPLGIPIKSAHLKWWCRGPSNPEALSSSGLN